MSLSESDIVAVDSDFDGVIVDQDDVSNYNPEQILPESPENIQKIRSWLRPTSYEIASGEYRKHLASHATGTGNWLTLTATYQDWLQGSEQGLLWIKGIPGSGKSVMAANLIDEIAKSNPCSPVLFFFFRQIINANHEPAALLRDWMDQVLSYSPPLQKQLIAYVESRRSIESISMDDMWKDLKTAFAGLSSKVFCIADALDEMDQGHDSFLQALGSLGQWRPEAVKVLITSRPVPSVEVPLRLIPCLQLRLHEHLVDVDIATYVQFTLSNSTIPQSSWRIIADAVPGKANGLFLYVKLAMDAFTEPGSDIMTTLSQLPADLNVLYTKLLQQHAQRSRVAADIQHLILQFVTHASRPLRLLELAEIIKVNGSIPDLKAAKGLVRTACGPLLEILADETISVVHHSFTEYLRGCTRSDDQIGYPILQPGPTNTELALSCLRYLQAGCLDAVEVKIKDDKDKRERDTDFYPYNGDDDRVTKSEVQLRLNHPFSQYAVSNWHYHINRSEAAGHDQTEINTELRKFLGDHRRMKVWLQIKWPKGQKCAQLVTQLHVAAKGGLVSYVKELLGSIEVDTLDISGKTPLWWAACEGHSSTVRELIAAGANPDQDESWSGLKPLHTAATNNHHEVVKVLLEAGVDPLTGKTRESPRLSCEKAPRTVGQTPLMYACHAGHLEVVEAFLPFLKDISTVHRALAWAAETGRSKVVARILQYPGVDVNTTVRGDTPLFLACGGSDVATITALLQAGANPNVECCGNGDEFAAKGKPKFVHAPLPLNCLHQLCGLGPRGRTHSYRMGAEDLQIVFSQLVQAGVDIHQHTRFGNTALHGAVDSPVLTRLLLDAGADANAINESGSAPLHRTRCSDSMALLIEQGHADINLPQADGQTPLFCILQTCDEKLIFQFLEYGPNCNLVDRAGNGALHVALQWWNSKPEIIQGLLKGGANPNLRNRDGLTPLLSLGNFNSYSEKIIAILVEEGADINAVDKDGANTFLRKVSMPPPGCGNDTHEALKELVDQGALTSARDFNGRTGLHEAVKFLWAPNSSTFDFLVGLGLDVEAVDYHGNGLLHELALQRRNHEPAHAPRSITFWEKLLAMGLNLEQKNHAGRTPLHLLCAANTHSMRFEQEKVMPIDFVISRTENIDNSDKNGITPLHIAVTVGELYAKKLLDAGANPEVVTDEGLTPLHLASRCRESNVVGLLLDALREKTRREIPIANDSSWPRESHAVYLSTTVASAEPVLGVNAITFGESDTFTPLFYACRSGRPETVSLLLEAGADVKHGRIFQAVESFEVENALWKSSDKPENKCGNGGAVALMLNDRSRPNLVGVSRPSILRVIGQPSLEFDNDVTPRIEEILDMLVKNGADLSQLEMDGRKNGCIGEAVYHNREYTAGCLRDARDSSQADSGTKICENTICTWSELVQHSMKETKVRMLKDSTLVKPGESNQAIFSHFLALREYHLVEELAHMGVTFLPTFGPDSICNFAILVQLGFASLVEKIGTLEANSRLKEGDWHAFGDSTRPGLWFAHRETSSPTNRCLNPEPFLLEALKRELPNIDVVRLLVEKFEVDINEQIFSCEYINNSYVVVSSNSALHFLAQGTSWWHVRQALPYLLKAGANLHIRNHKGQTPLHLALGGDGHWSGPFHKEAARILVEAGSDVNAVDGGGQNCLACAQNDVDMTKLLRTHGATVTAEAIFSAIDAQNIEVLREILSGEVDADICQKPGAEPAWMRRYNQHRWAMIGDPTPQKLFPLYCAAKKLYNSPDPPPEVLRKLEVGAQLIQVLLDHGADPFAKFLREVEEPRSTFYKRLEDSTPETPSIEVPEGYRECTVLHELLCEGKVVDNLLCIPKLDVNHRDAKGRTLLHAACQSYSGPDYTIDWYKENPDQSERLIIFQRLISLGVELEARDNFGRNVLHYMLIDDHGKDFDKFKDSFAYTVEKVPGLMYQADNNGMTPLHYAVVRATLRSKTVEAELLVSAGADYHAVNNNGDSVLHILTRSLHVAPLRDFFEDMVGRGVDVNGRNSQGETPLFAFYNCPKRFGAYAQTSYYQGQFTEDNAVPMLKKLGADFFTRDPKGRGLLHVAATGDVQRFKELIDLGLDVMLENDAQQTPLDVAAACGNREVMELFEKK